MAIAWVHSTEDNITNGLSAIVSVPAVGSGNLVVVACECQNSSPAAVLSIIDNVGNTYALCTNSIVSGGDGFELELWYAKNVTGNPTTITVTYSSAAYAQLTVFEFSGADLSSPFVSAATIATTGSPVSPTLTPTASGSVLVAIGASPASAGVNSPWVGNNPGFETAEACFAYYVNPPTSATFATWTPTTSIPYASNVAIFAPPASGPSTKQKASTFLVL